MNGTATTVYVGGQNAVDASGALVGRGDQTEQVLRNVEIALATGGATLEQSSRNVYIV